MRQARSSSSWSVRSGGPNHHLTILAYLRDAAGLSAPTDYVLPPLAPAVPLHAELAPYATADAAEAWIRWWEQALGPARRLLTPDGFMPQALAPPEPGTDLRALYDAGVDRAHDWMRLRTTEFHERWRRRHGHPSAGETVRRLERELGHDSAPFALEVRLLPLDRRWGRRMDTDLAVVSEALWFDEDARDLFLERILRTLME